MKTLPTGFESAHNDEGVAEVRRVSYKRRYWDEATKAYKWEASWTPLASDKVVSVGAITEQLDIDAPNEFKVSNLNLVLKNDTNQWVQSNPFGIFKKDAGSPAFGYLNHWTKFRVESGYEVDFALYGAPPSGLGDAGGGLGVYVTVFVGLATSYLRAGNSDTIQVQIQGLESILKNADAENVSTTVANEVLTGTVDGANKDFTTAQPGVGIFDIVTIDGFAKDPGTDYSTSQMNDPNLSGKITFAVAPTVGTVPRATYRYWKQDQKIEDLVSDLLLEAGIALPDQDISPVIFPGVANLLTIDTEAEWLAGTLTAIDTSFVPNGICIDIADATNNQLVDDFADGDYTSSPAWTVSGNPTVSVSANRLRIQKSGGAQKGTVDLTPAANQSGRWVTAWSNSSGLSWPDNWTFAFGASARVNDPTFPFYPYEHAGNYVRWSVPLADNVQKWELVLNGVTVAQGGYQATTGVTYYVVVDRRTNGYTRMTVYSGSVGGTVHLVLEGTSTSPVTPNFLGFGTGNLSSTQDHYYDDIRQPNTTLAAVWESPAYDLTASVTAYGQIVWTQTLGTDASITWETNSSANGSVWEGWTAVSGDGTVNSTVQRYFKIRITFSQPSSLNGLTYVSKFTFAYSTTSTLIALANFSGQSVYDAIQSLGAFASYEWGFKADESFFFRPRAASAAVDKLLENNDILDVSNVSDGFDRMFSEVRASFGGFEVRIKDPGDTPSGPRALAMAKILNIDGGDLLLAPDTDVATGIAKQAFTAFSKPRRTAKVRSKLMVWVDLSDTLQVNFVDKPGGWWIGDTGVYLGQTDIYLHGPEAQTLTQFVAKVVGVRHDIENQYSEFDLEEILT